MPKELILLIPSAVLLIYALYLRFFIVLELRKKLREGAARAAQITASPDNPEVERLRERIQVLERIATDRHSALEHEFDQLRTVR